MGNKLSRHNTKCYVFFFPCLSDPGITWIFFFSPNISVINSIQPHSPWSLPFLTPLISILMLTPLSNRLSNSSLILRSCRPYFLAAQRAGGADLERPRNGAPSVGVPASSSPLAWSSSSLETVEAWDSEFSLIRPVTTWERERWEGVCDVSQEQEQIRISLGKKAIRESSRNRGILSNDWNKVFKKGDFREKYK